MLALSWREMEDPLRLCFARLHAGLELLPTQPTGTSPVTTIFCRRFERMPCLRLRERLKERSPECSVLKIKVIWHVLCCAP